MNLFLCFYHDSLKNHEKVCIIKNYSYFCKPIYAKVAQLVEHNLAKVRVAGSSPVFRSNKIASKCWLFLYLLFCINVV